MPRMQLISFAVAVALARTASCDPLEVLYDDLSTFQSIAAFFTPVIDGTPQYPNDPAVYLSGGLLFPDQDIPVEISSDRTSARFLVPYVDHDPVRTPVTGSFDLGFTGKPTFRISLTEYSLRVDLPTVALDFAANFGPTATTYSAHMVGSVDFSGTTMPLDETLSGLATVSGDFDQGYPDPLSPDLTLVLDLADLPFSIPIGHVLGFDLSVDALAKPGTLRLEALRLPEPSAALLLILASALLAFRRAWLQP